MWWWCCQRRCVLELQAALRLPAALATPPPHHHHPPCLQLLFIDTEGFESTGKADTYDDRIFALSALMSQVGGRCWCGGQRGSRKEVQLFPVSACEPGRKQMLVWRGMGVAGRQAGSNGGSQPVCDQTHARALAIPPPQILVYNLPESIRESDLEKLSFAVELGKAFFSAEGLSAAGAGGAAEGGNGLAAAQGGGGALGGDALPIQPGNMVWLIQRDFLQVRAGQGVVLDGRPLAASFCCDSSARAAALSAAAGRPSPAPPLCLQGKTLDQTLSDALQPVPNPHSDPGIAQLNRIRTSLSLIAANSTAVGLPQVGARTLQACGSTCSTGGSCRRGSRTWICTLTLPAPPPTLPPTFHAMQPHLDRTRLCELGEEVFEPAYIQKREALKALIRSLAQPKVRGWVVVGWLQVRVGTHLAVGATARGVSALCS